MFEELSFTQLEGRDRALTLPEQINAVSPKA